MRRRISNKRVMAGLDPAMTLKKGGPAAHRSATLCLKASA